MSFDGWIKCGEHQPPEGVAFDVKHPSGTVLLAADVHLNRNWTKRRSEGHCWRPSPERGWRLNDGTKPSCELVDVVFHNGCHDSCMSAHRLNWLISWLPKKDWLIAYWRPHQVPASEPEPVTLPAFKHIDDVLPWMEYVHDKPATKSVAIKCDGLLLDSKKSVKEALHAQGFATCEVMIGRAEVLAGALFR